MAGEGPRYISEEDAYGGMLKNLNYSPPDDQQGTADPQQVASVLPPTPADEPPNPTLKTRPQPAAPVRQAAPIQAAPSQPAAPAAVPASRYPERWPAGYAGRRWADYVRAGLGIVERKPRTLRRQPLPPSRTSLSAEQQNADLIAKRAGISGNPPNPNAPEDKPGIGTRIARGIDAFRRGGVLLAWSIQQDTWRRKAYGGPNRQYDIDTSAQGGAGRIDRQKHLAERSTTRRPTPSGKKARLRPKQELRTQQPRSTTLARRQPARRTPENNADKVKMQGDLNDIKQQLADPEVATFDQRIRADCRRHAGATEEGPSPQSGAYKEAAKTMAATESEEIPISGPRARRSL